MKTFRIPRETRPPEPFTIEYEAEEYEKVEVPDPDGGPSRFEERATGRWLWETSQVFHARYGVPSGLLIDLEKGSGAAMDRAIRAAIVEADEFHALIRDPRVRIDPNYLAEIFAWIVSLSANRPTSRPSS